MEERRNPHGDRPPASWDEAIDRMAAIIDRAMARREAEHRAKYLAEHQAESDRPAPSP